MFQYHHQHIRHQRGHHHFLHFHMFWYVSDCHRHIHQNHRNHSMPLKIIFWKNTFSRSHCFKGHLFAIANFMQSHFWTVTFLVVTYWKVTFYVSLFSKITQTYDMGQWILGKFRIRYLLRQKIWIVVRLDVRRMMQDMQSTLTSLLGHLFHMILEQLHHLRFWLWNHWHNPKRLKLHCLEKIFISLHQVLHSYHGY